MHCHLHKPPHCPLLIQRLNSGLPLETLYPDRLEDSGTAGKTCCDILHSFTVPKGNEQGAAGLPVSCLAMQGGKTGKNQFPGAAGESGQDR